MMAESLRNAWKWLCALICATLICAAIAGGLMDYPRFAYLASIVAIVWVTRFIRRQFIP